MTVMSASMPELVPASMVTVWVNDCAGPMATTRAGTSARSVVREAASRPSSSAAR